MLLVFFNSMQVSHPTGSRASLDLGLTLTQMAGLLAIGNVAVAPGAGKVRPVQIVSLISVELSERKRLLSTLWARIV